MSCFFSCEDSENRGPGKDFSESLDAGTHGGPPIPETAGPLMESQQIGIDGLSRALYFCREKGRNAVQIMQVQKEDIRSRVLAAARRQFGRKGYSGTSMREIAASAGVGVGNIYNYFTSKDDLFREVVRPVLCALEAMLQEHHGIRGEDIMMMRSEKYLKSCCCVLKDLRWSISGKTIPTVPRRWSRRGLRPCSGSIRE